MYEDDLPGAILSKVFYYSIVYGQKNKSAFIA